MKSHSPASSGGGATSTTAGNLKDNKKAFKGVRMRGWGSWVSEIGNPHQKTRIWLGSYSSPEAAARAYHAAFLCLKGSSVPILSSKSIQRIAASAAAVTTSSPSSPADLIKSTPFSAVAIDAADPLVDFRECQLSQHKWFMDDHTMNQFAFPATGLPAEELNEIAGNITLWCFLR